MEANIKELEKALTIADVIYLSTCQNKMVSSRPVSPLNIGSKLYFRSSSLSRKARDIEKNPNVSVCVQNFYFTGTAYSLGIVEKKENERIKKAYLARYPGSFGDKDTFISEDECFFEIHIAHVFEWVLDKGEPICLAEKKIDK